MKKMKETLGDIIACGGCLVSISILFFQIMEWLMFV